MLCCIGEIACFVFGIIALVRGRFQLTGSRVVEGGSARAIGVLLLLPIILGQGGGVLYVVIWMMQHGAQGAQFDFNNMGQMQQQLQTPLLIINVVGAAVPLLIAFVIAVTNAKPAAPRRKRYKEDEEDDFDDTYRRRRDDDEGEPPPRRPRDYDEPRP